MPKDRGAEFCRPAQALQFAHTDERVFLGSGMALVIEVVEDAGGAVELNEGAAVVSNEATSLGFCFSASSDTYLNGQGMLAKALAPGPLS